MVCIFIFDYLQSLLSTLRNVKTVRMQWEK